MTERPCPLSGEICRETSAPTAPVLDRRAMLTQSMVIAAGAALAACGIGDFSTAPATLSPFTLKVADYSQLASVGGIALLSAQGSPIAVVRTGTSTFVALSRICPHQGATIGTAGSGFECPRHHSQYTADGTWIGGQRTNGMHSYPAVFDATAGTLTIG